MTLHMKMILLSLVLLTVGFEVAYGGKLLKRLNKTKGQGGQERINGNSTKWVMRKVRKMIKAFNILEKQVVSASASNSGDIVTLTSAVGTNAANIVSNDADIASLVTDTATNNASIASIDVELATLTGNVTSNTAGVASNSANIVSNEGDIVDLVSVVGSISASIASNDADIASLVQDTSNNTAYLASQSSAIGTLQIDVNTNEAGIATNLANIASNVVDIDSHDSRINDVQNDMGDVQNDMGDVQNDMGDVQNDMGDVQNEIVSLKTNGSGSVWFDAWRSSNFEASGFTTITYTNVRESNSGAMDIGTGVFTAQLAGTYQFMIQVAKDIGVDGEVQILLDGNTPAISYITDRDQPNQATITGTAIVKMQPGQMVRAETHKKLFSHSQNPRIHFTGVLITPD